MNLRSKFSLTAFVAVAALMAALVTPGRASAQLDPSGVPADPVLGQLASKNNFTPTPDPNDPSLPVSADGSKGLADLTGLWGVPAQPGWGLSLTRIGATVFGAWFTYTQNGTPTWYVASSCHVTDSVCTGDLYAAKLLIPPTLITLITNFDPKLVTVERVGSISLDFRDLTRPVFSYELEGRSGRHELARQIFRVTGTDGLADWNGTWFNPGESGWGVTVTQQRDVMFVAWYTFETSGLPTWHVVSNCELTADRQGCEGDVYHTGGPLGPLAGVDFDPHALAVRSIGRLLLRFNDSDTGEMFWNLVEGRNKSGSSKLSRFKF